MIYKILHNNKYIYISIDILLKYIKDNPNDIYYKYINNKKIKINNNIVINTIFIIHRINTIEELNNIDKQFGVEIDLRDKNDKIILSHDPFKDGEYFDRYLNYYKHKIIILNIKSERIEKPIIDILNKNYINDYFFLDSSFPMIYLLNKQYNNNNIALRYSEFESINTNLDKYYKYIWIDCFTKFPLNKEIYENIKNKKICIVSPELQQQFNKIEEYRDILLRENIIPNYICCKLNNIIYWI